MTKMNWRKAGLAGKQTAQWDDGGPRSIQRRGDAILRKAERREKNRPKPTVAGGGIPCPRCGQLTQIREHKELTDKILAQPFYYSRWFYCDNKRCKTTLIMRDEYKVESGVVSEIHPNEWYRNYA